MAEQTNLYHYLAFIQTLLIPDALWTDLAIAGQPSLRSLCITVPKGQSEWRGFVEFFKSLEQKQFSVERCPRKVEQSVLLEVTPSSGSNECNGMREAFCDH